MTTNQAMIGATCTGCAMDSKRLGKITQRDLGSADKWHHKCYQTAQRLGLTMTAKSSTRQYEEGVLMDGWEVTFTHLESGRTMTTPYYMGTGWDGARPGILLVLEGIMDDSSLDETFEEWAGDFGYDSDSRKALDLYVRCQDQARKVHALLGDDYNKVQREVRKWGDA